MKYYAADLHLRHNNIIKFSNRPFKNIEEMDETLIRNWNAKVTPNDEVYILGDFTFGNAQVANDYLGRLNGRKYLIKGNHDGYIREPDFDRSHFVWVRDCYTVFDGNTKIVLFHYPIAVWDCQHQGALHFYGHIHNNHHPEIAVLKNAFNVGVDMWNYAPVTLAEIKKGQPSLFVGE